METTGTRHKVNLISAINPRGAMIFMATEDSVNSAVFIEFLNRLIANSEKPVFLILDNSSIHRSTVVGNFVEGTNGKLRIIFLPPYAPELNSDELVWNYLKNQKIGRQSITGQWDLYQRVAKIMRSLQKCPEKIQSFFRHPWTKYTLVSAGQ